MPPRTTAEDAGIRVPGHPGRVSCIIPAYNAISFLGFALDAALSQTYPDIEIVVVDDGSTDGTEDFVRSHYGDRVLFFRQERAGVAAARNRALSASSGEFINLLDADDVWPSDRLAVMVEAMNVSPGWAGCFSLWCNFWDDPELERQDREQSAAIIGVQRDMMLTAALLRRSCFQTLGLFDPRFRYGSEREWTIRLHDSGATLGHVGQVLFRRRIHRANDSRGKVVDSEIVQILLDRHRRMRSAKS